MFSSLLKSASCEQCFQLSLATVYIYYVPIVDELQKPHQKKNKIIRLRRATENALVGRNLGGPDLHLVVRGKFENHCVEFLKIKKKLIFSNILILFLLFNNFNILSPTAGSIVSVCHSMHVSWWLNEQVSPPPPCNRNFIPPFLHTHSFHSSSFNQLLQW